MFLRLINIEILKMKLFRLIIMFFKLNMFENKMWLTVMNEKCTLPVFNVRKGSGAVFQRLFPIASLVWV